jgi:hypothetical protein
MLQLVLVLLVIMMMDSPLYVKLVTILVLPVLVTQNVLLVLLMLTELFLLVNVHVILISMTTVLLSVTNVLSNVPNVKDHPITVPLVPKTELVPQIVIVISKVVIMKSPNKPSVHLVTVDVIPVLLMKLVNPVQLTELKMPQIVVVSLISMKMLPNVPVKNVVINVLNVLLQLITVALVLVTEFLLQVVSVQMELMMIVLTMLNVKSVTQNVVLVPVVMVLV